LSFDDDDSLVLWSDHRPGIYFEEVACCSELVKYGDQVLVWSLEHREYRGGTQHDPILRLIFRYGIRPVIGIEQEESGQEHRQFRRRMHRHEIFGLLVLHRESWDAH
jgi:hypothetical protein